MLFCNSLGFTCIYNLKLQFSPILDDVIALGRGGPSASAAGTVDSLFQSEYVGYGGLMEQEALYSTNGAMLSSLRFVQFTYYI